jgi:phage terminase large subunit-like protein
MVIFHSYVSLPEVTIFGEDLLGVPHINNYVWHTWAKTGGRGEGGTRSGERGLAANQK